MENECRPQFVPRRHSQQNPLKLVSRADVRLNLFTKFFPCLEEIHLYTTDCHCPPPTR